MKSLFVSLIILSASAWTTAASAASYACKKSGSSVCAVNLATGQCTHSWSTRDGGNPEYECLRYLGVIPSKVDRAPYSCKRTSNGACAVDSRTGQCTHSWRSGEDSNPMDSCRRWMGLGPKKIDRTGFFCRKSGSSYCAVNPRTNQCTHSWNQRDGDARGECERFIRR